MLITAFASHANIAVADLHVSVAAYADPAYTQRKFSGPEVRPEAYVFMEGRYFSGLTVDRSIERMSFRRIAEALATELGRQKFFPAQDLPSADLLIVVHWGTTQPIHEEHQTMSQTQQVTDIGGTRVTGVDDALNIKQWDDQRAGYEADENGKRMFSIGEQFPDTATGLDGHLVANPFAQAGEAMANEMTAAGNIDLLGYDRSMRRHARAPVAAPEEGSLRFDLTTERYFIVLKAYDLRKKVSPGQRRRAVWTVHLNMRSAGINFEKALASMSATSADFVGRDLDTVKITRPRIREGKVEIGEPIVLGEVR